MQKISIVVEYSKVTQVLQWALKTFAYLNVIAFSNLCGFSYSSMPEALQLNLELS